MTRISRPDYILSTLLFLYIVFLPFEEALASTFGSILRLIGLSIIIYCLLIVFRQPTIKLNYLQICLILWLALSVFSFLWVESVHWWSYFIRIYIGQIGFFLLLSMIPAERFNLKWIRFAMATGAIITALVIVVFPTDMLLTAEGRRTLIIWDSSFDPNIVCAILSLGFFVVLSHLGKDLIAKKQYILNILVLIIILTGIFFTGSRGGIISIVLAFVLWFVLYQRNNRHWFQGIKFTLLSVIIVMVIFQFLPENLLNARFSLQNLLGLNEIQNEAHSRYKIWSYTWELFKQRPILGWGTGNFFMAISSVYRESAAHNMYILILIETGLVGLMLFVMALLQTLKKLLRSNDYNTLATFVSILLICISLDGITYKFFWVAWIYAYLMGYKSVADSSVKLHTRRSKFNG